MAGCNANLEYDIGYAGPRADCRHTNGYFYCSAGEAGHAGKHQALVTFDASTEKQPFLYKLDALIEWD